MKDEQSRHQSNDDAVGDAGAVDAAVSGLHRQERESAMNCTAGLHLCLLLAHYSFRICTVHAATTGQIGMIAMGLVSAGKGMLADAAVGGILTAAAAATFVGNFCFVTRDHVGRNENQRCFDPSAGRLHLSALSSRPQVYPMDQEGQVLARILDSPAWC